MIKSVWRSDSTLPRTSRVSVVHDSSATSPGWFALRLGLGPALSSLVAHVAYGVSLSVVYGRQGATSVDGRPTRVWTDQTPVQF